MDGQCLRAVLNGLKEYVNLMRVFIKGYHEVSDIGYFLDVNVQYREISNNLYNGLTFLQERMNFEKVEKLVANLYDKKGYINTNLKHVLNYRLVWKKVH